MSQPISLHRQNFSLCHEIQLIAEGSVPPNSSLNGRRNVCRHCVACLSAQGEVS